MRRDRPDPARLRDMLDMARVVESLVKGVQFEAYVADVTRRLAVERAIMIIGEAAYHVSAEFQSLHPEIAWSKIARQRHRLVHDYDDIDDRLIWNVAAVHVPALVVLLEPIVGPELEPGA